jgi:hypothetical protein
VRACDLPSTRCDLFSNDIVNERGRSSRMLYHLGFKGVSTRLYPERTDPTFSMKSPSLQRKNTPPPAALVPDLIEERTTAVATMVTRAQFSQVPISA